MPGNEPVSSSGWARDLYASVEPQMTGGAYVNFISAGDDRVAEAYPGPTFERLSVVKGAWDPTNLFHLNQNIQPG